MRITKVQVYWWLTLAVPLVVSCLLLAIAAASDEPRPRDDPRINFAFYCFLAAILVSVFMFPMLALREHQSGVQSVAFSLDGHFLATASHDTTVKIWYATPLTDTPGRPPQARSESAEDAPKK